MNYLAIFWISAYAAKLSRDFVRWIRWRFSEELRASELVVTAVLVRRNPEATREMVFLASQMMVEAQRIRRFR